MATCSIHPGEPLPGCAPCRSDPVELDATLAAWVQAARAAADQIAYYTEIRDRAVEHIQAAMGDATSATIGGRPAVSWKTSKPGKYIDRAALEADLPDVAAKYTRFKQAARPFRILTVDGA